MLSLNQLASYIKEFVLTSSPCSVLSIKQKQSECTQPRGCYVCGVVRHVETEKVAKI
jgi:hypothetical protein